MQPFSIGIIAALAGLSVTTAAAQDPESVGKMVYRLDLAANYCGVKQTQQFEDWSVRALQRGKEQYFRGYDRGADVYDPEFKKIGTVRWCEKHVPALRRVFPGFLE